MDLMTSVSMPIHLPKLSEHYLTAAFSLFSAVDSIELLTQDIGRTAVKDTSLASRKSCEHCLTAAFSLFCISGDTLR